MFELSDQSSSSMRQPLVSVLMPAFNADEYLREAIESILGQSYAYFELIICNDGSTDESASIIQSYTDPRIVYLENPQNAGLVFTRNRLVSAAQGQYIALMDADDIAEPNRLALQVHHLEHGGVDVCGTDHTSFGYLRKSKRSRGPYRDADIKALLTVYCPLCNPSIMGKAEIFKEHPYSTTYPLAEDFALWQELAALGYRFQNLPHSGLRYRMHSKQTSQLGESQTRVLHTTLQKEYLQKLRIDPGLYPHAQPLSLRIPRAWELLHCLTLRFGVLEFRTGMQIYARYQIKSSNLLVRLGLRLERFFTIALFWAKQKSGLIRSQAN